MSEDFLSHDPHGDTRFNEPLIHLKQNQVSCDGVTLDWGIEVVFQGMIYVRKELLNVEGMTEPNRVPIKQEFFAKRHLYEVVGELGKGRVDTGEFDFTSATTTTAALAEFIRVNEVERLRQDEHTAEQLAEIEQIEAQEAEWVEQQKAKAAKELEQYEEKSKKNRVSPPN